MTRPTIRIAPATQIDRGPRPETAPPKAALRALLLAPHRLAFFAGGVMLLFASFAWVVWLLLSAPLWPSTSVTLPAAAALWTLVWTSWAARYLPILLRPRADGRPG